MIATTGRHNQERRGSHSSSRTSREVNSGSFQSRYGVLPPSADARKSHFSLSFLSRNSNDNERKKQEERKNSDELNDELSLGKLPDQNERLKDSLVMKLCQEEWQPRFIMVTGGLSICKKMLSAPIRA